MAKSYLCWIPEVYNVLGSVKAWVAARFPTTTDYSSMGFGKNLW